MAIAARGLPPVFNVAKIIDAALEDDDEADPHRLVVDVMLKIPMEQSRAALRWCLAEIIRQRAFLRTAPRAARRQPQKGEGGNASAKWGRVQTVEKILKTHIYTADKEGTWKFLEDCSIADLLMAAHSRRRMAALTIAKAEKLERLAAELKERELNLVGELDPEVVQAIWLGREVA